jgi:hypothetical protein
MVDKVKKATDVLESLTDEQLLALQFTMPWQYDAEVSGYKDPDGFKSDSKSKLKQSREVLQTECWNKFNTNPHLNTAVRGIVGRLAGAEFEISSEVREIQDTLEDEWFDPRNRLYNFMPKYVGRSLIEGELFLCLTVNPDSFIEVDFVDPSAIVPGNGSDDGVFWHPTKTTMPVAYNIEMIVNGIKMTTQIPSVFVARYPDILPLTKKVSGYVIDDNLLNDSRDSSNKYKSIGGFKRFIVSWDKSFITGRNIPYLRTVIEWLNQYEMLKKYEIDHKRSAGSYLWIVTIEDPKAFRVWLGMSDDDRRKTGIMAKKTPGSTLVLPPGMKAQVLNPNLPKISEADTDILHMITSGLNEPEDVATGQSKGTFASVKASRGPMSDRTSDEVSYFERFLKYDFFGNIFFLKASASSFPFDFKVREVVDFKKGEPVFEYVRKRPEFLLDIVFPGSEVNDPEVRAGAYLGVKHGSLYDTLGIPNKVIAKKLGFGNYKRLRMKQATEEDLYPELAPPVDAGGQQQEPGTVKPVLKKQQKGGK